MEDWKICTSSKNCTHKRLSVDGLTSSVPYIACRLLGRGNIPCAYYACPLKIEK